jgi:hypothetical protein
VAAEVAAGDTFRQRRRERAQDEIDRRRNRSVVLRHRRVGRSAHDLPVRQNDLERAERPLVRRFVDADQVLEGQPRDRFAAAVTAGIESPVDLIRHPAEIDRHLVVADDHADVQRDRRVIDPVVVEEAAGGIFAVGNLTDARARE